MLVIDELSYRIGGRMVLERISASIPPRARVALVGRNGAGKTTLLRLILGETQPDGGAIRIARGLIVASVAQEAPGGRCGGRQALLGAADEHRRHVEGTHRIARIS